MRATEKVFDEKNGMLLADLPIDVTATARVDLADHQRFSFAYLFGASVLMTLAGVAFGVLPV